MPSVFLSSDNSVTASVDALILPYPKVSVLFRLPNGFNGEFGFDWVRTGDTGSATGDTWYRDIIGSYSGATFTGDVAKYSRLLRKYQTEEHPTREGDRYVVPVVTLMKGKKAKFTLKLDVGDEPTKLEFVYDPACFSLNHDEITDKSVGKRSLVDFLEVECIEEFDTNQDIEVLADGHFAGRLKFLANDSSHRAYKRIEMVKVIVDLNGDGVPSTPNLTGESSGLRKYLSHSLITAGIWTKELDLSSDATMNSTHRHTFNGAFEVKKTDALATFLDTKFNAAFPEDASHYKIFFFNEQGGRFASDGSYVGLNGFAPIGGKKVVLFKSHGKDSTIHEFLHSIGLYHSFDNSSEFTFEKKKTDNIMDYSHTASPPIKRKSTWYWQWKKANSRISSI